MSGGAGQGLDRRRLISRAVESLFDVPHDAREAEAWRLAAGDAEVARAILARLAFDDGRDGTDTDDTRHPAGPAPAHAAPPRRPGPGDVIAGCTIVRELQSGGSATIYEAEQTPPGRKVALKILRPERLTADFRRRFDFEARALARMTHPAIARVFGVARVPASHTDDASPAALPGAFPVAAPGGDAVPCLIMEFVEGARPLTVYAREKRLPRRQRLALFCELCDAVHHAHTKGVLHRDLKPANILVDAEGRLKVIDFGIAKPLSAELVVPFSGDDAAEPAHTGVYDLVGTLSWMSPEQCGPNPSDVDTRADVYALGVVLFELLTDRLPLSVSNLGLAAAIDLIRERTPPRAADLDPTLRGDLDVIVAKAMRRDREQRFESAAALRDDVRRHIAGEPVLARPPSVAYRLAKLAGRRPAATVALSLGVSAAVLLGAVTTGFAIRERALRESRAAAQRAAAEADALAATLREQFAALLEEGARPESLVSPPSVEDLVERQLVRLSESRRDAADRGAVADAERLADTEAGLRALLAEAYADQGRDEDARAQLSQSLGLLRGLPTTPRRAERAQGISLDLAASYFRAARPAEAVDVYARALGAPGGAAPPADRRVAMGLHWADYARALAALQRFGESVDAFDEALRLLPAQPDDAALATLVGLAQADRRRAEAARRAVSGSIAPTSADSP